jgi:hypothetical protein
LADLDEKRVFVVGAPQNIGYTGQYEFKWKHNRIIGLIGGGNIEVVTELINMLKKFGNLHGYKIYIKFHPAFGKKCFSQEILKDIDKMYETEIDVQGFHDMVDFAVDYGSTTFSEYMVYGKMAFTYQYRNDIVYARDTNIKLGFKNYDEMEKLFLMYENEDDELLKQLEYNKSYFGTKELPSILYKRFFEEYL